MKYLTIFAFLTLWAPDVRAFELKVTADILVEEIREVSLLTPLVGPETGGSIQDIIAASQADYARLIGLMYDRGYFGPQISILIDGSEAASLSALRPPQQISTIEVRVDVGQQFKFGIAKLSPLPLKNELPATFRAGQVASTKTLHDAVEEGISAWRNDGYAKAEVSSQNISAHHSEHRIDADIQLSTGPRLRFGDLRIDGNQQVRSKRIVEIAGLPTGEVFDPNELSLAATRLRRSGAFTVVSLAEAEDISFGDTLDIITQLAEAKPRRFGFGAELSTQDGLAFSTFWMHRNLFGGAERLRIGAEVKGIGGETDGVDFEVSFAFGRPATFNEDTDFYLDANIASLDEPNFSLDRFSAETGIRRYATPRRVYTLGVGVDIANTTDAFGTRSYSILTLPLSAEFDYRDDRLNATKGYFARVDLTPFLNLRGSANGVRGYVDTRAYHSVGRSKHVTFALRGQLGFVSGPSLSQAPSDYLFYSGGGGTVRGQDFQSLGVDLGGGDTVGGRSFLGLSSEMRVKTGDKLSVVGFFDAGYVGTEGFPDGSGDWQSGAGFGIRYDTGIGPVRLDVGVPVSGPDTSSSFGLYIGIGQAF